jgi:hypothetical protein
VGIRHSAKVAASSLFEAAVLGVAALRKSVFVRDGPLRFERLTVAVQEPTTTHEVTMTQIEEWLRVAGKPREMVLKHDLQQILKVMRSHVAET